MSFRYNLAFPNLRNVPEKKTSDPDPAYNCIAWAFKDNQRHWWPNSRRSFWPISVAGLTAMEAFEAWFSADGWEETSSRAAEDGFEKVVLYALEGRPTHAARLLPNGDWTSKLGADIDLSHNSRIWMVLSMVSHLRFTGNLFL